MSEQDTALVDRCRRLWEYAKTAYRSRNDKIERELAFALKLRHYENDPGQTKNPARLKFRGRELYSKLRRKSADVVSAPLYIETLPNGLEPFDSDAAEDAKYALEMDIRDEDKGFEVYLERMVLGGLAARVWAMAVDFDPDCGPFGEILFRNVDPTRLFKCPGFQDVWDKRLPWLAEDDDMRLEDALSMPGWDNVDLLYAEDSTGRRHSDGTDGTDASGAVIVKDSGQDGGTPRQSGRFKLLKLWFKFDDSVKKNKRTDKARPLAQEDYHLACPQCGWTSPPSAETPDIGVCPQCGGVAQRAEMQVPEETVKAYPNGRLVICAPNQGVLLYDGPWPHKMRHYPYVEFKCNEHPIDSEGLSDTALDWYPQIASNASMRRLYDQVMSAPNIIAVGGSSATDSTGQPFDFSDEPWQIMYFADPAEVAGIQQFKMTSQSADISGLYNLLQSNMRADMGTADLGSLSDPQKSSDVPVGTVNAVIENQNVPTNHHIRSLRRALGPFFGVIHDIQRETWTPAKWAAYKGPDGLMSAKRMSGSQIPNVKFRITASPDFKARTKEELDTITYWRQNGSGEALAALLNIPPTLARAMKQEEAENQQGPPPTPPDRLMLGLAALFKSGVPVSLPDVNGLLQQAGLPPLMDQSAPPPGMAPPNAPFGIPPQMNGAPPQMGPPQPQMAA